MGRSQRLPYWLLPLISAMVAAFLLAAGYLLLRRDRRRLEPPDVHRSLPPIFVSQLSGLSEIEAAARQIPLDREALKKTGSRRFWRQLLRNHLFTFFNLDMIGVALMMYVLGSPWSTILSLLVLVLSFGLNVFQEIYTKRHLDRLVAGLQPQATVIRQSRVHGLPLETVVPGDLLVVGIGDRLVANGEIVGTGKIWVEEAASSGGVVRRLKQVGDPVQAGSICIKGQAVYRVSEVELLQTLLTQELKASLLPDKPTPLQRLIKRIFQILFVLVLVFNALLFIDLGATWLGLAIFDGVLIRDIVGQIFAIAPTSLFLMIAVSYAVGLLRIADVGALVYRADMVESLANTSVICFSSSETLTGAQASLELVPAPAGQNHLSERRIRRVLGHCLHSFPAHHPLRLALAQTFPGEFRAAKEVAPFYSAFGWSGLSFTLDDLRGTYVLGNGDLLAPFLAPGQAGDESEQQLEEPAKPAQASRLSRLKRFWRFNRATKTGPVSETGPVWPTNEVPLPAVPEEGRPSVRQRWTARLRRWLAPQSFEPETEAGRPDAATLSLLLAYCPEPAPLHNEAGLPQLPPQLLPLGWVHVFEGVRPGAAAVVRALVKAGVDIKVFSSAAADRLAATVKQLALSDQATPPVVSGADLAQLAPASFASTVQSQDFFARLTPDQQAAMVGELRSLGAYVAVVGGQVTDIPAMRQADLSITSPLGGQAALMVADIVLLDQSLAVLPNVLYRGQQIVNGLLDTFKLYLTHVAAHLLLLMTVVLILSLPMPYSSTQTSIVSFFSITVPAIFLPFWASLGRVSQRSMTRQLIHFVLPAALTTSLLTVLLSVWYLNTTSDLIYTRLVVTHALVAAGLLRVIFVKPPSPGWTGGNPLSGDWRPFWMAVSSGALYVVFVVITNAVPTFQEWFDLQPLTSGQDILIVVVAVGLWAIVTRTLWRWLSRHDT